MSLIRRVACAVSGGVDSAVSALLLKQKGYEVLGVYMDNWDTRDETGHCASAADRADAQFVCDRLDIPLHYVSFVKQYWNHVFLYLLREYKHGFTPNPDVYCNKYIKFDAFLHHVTERYDVDAIATGHYARIGHCDDSEDVRLLRAADDNKDQTLFLSQISQHALRRCLFPVGHMMKSDVKRVARDCGLGRIARKKESMGICFIGKRDFKSFIEKYIEPKRGVFIDIETNRVIGHHNGLHNYTIGQRSNIAGQATAYFVVKMDTQSQHIFVAPGTHHPSLYSDSFATEPPHWINLPPPPLTTSGRFSSQFQFQHIHPTLGCEVKSKRSSLEALHVTLERPLRAITPGQFAVFYNKQECLGSARILNVGQSLYELDEADRPVISKDFT